MLIYKLEFANNGIYVGKTSKKMEDRFKEHCRLMKVGKHHSYKVQAAYSTVGIPIVSLLELCSAETLTLREKYWISLLDSYANGLNCSPGGETNGYGEDHIASKYTNDDYLAVVYCLAYTDWSIRQVSEELSVGYETVKHIYAGRTNTHLAEIIPDIYRLMIERRDRIPTVISPENITYSVSNIKEFITTHNLNGGRFNLLLHKKIPMYKGWRTA